MQRSDICNINRLFLESTLRDFFVYGVIQEEGNRCEIVDEETVSAKTLRDVAATEMISRFAETPYRFIEAFESTSRGVLVAQETDEDNIFIVSVSPIHPSDITDMFIDARVSVAFKRINAEDLVNHYKYKQTATRDVDAELGFDDLLDVL